MVIRAEQSDLADAGFCTTTNALFKKQTIRNRLVNKTAFLRTSLEFELYLLHVLDFTTFAKECETIR